MSLSHAEWADALRDGDLLGVRCTDCDATYGTPFAVCNKCGSRDMETTELPTEGEVYTETTIEVSPTGFEAPYRIGIVQLGNARVIGRLEGSIDIGDDAIFSKVRSQDGKPVPIFRGL